MSDLTEAQKEEELSKWLHAEVPKWIVNADTDTFVEFVLELIRQGSGELNRRTFLTEQLQGFLEENTDKFIDKLENALDNETYMKRESSRSGRRRHRKSRSRSRSRERRRSSRSRSPRSSRRHDNSKKRAHDRKREPFPSFKNFGRGGRGGRGGFPQHQQPMRGGMLPMSPTPGLLGAGPPATRREIAYPQGDSEANPSNMRTVRVTRIPYQLCNLGALIQYFQRFGHIENTSLRGENGEAFIQFSDPDSATRVVKDPSPVCNDTSILVRLANYELGARRPRGSKPGRGGKRLSENNHENQTSGNTYEATSGAYNVKKYNEERYEKERTPQEQRAEFLRKQEEKQTEVQKMIEEQNEKYRRLKEDVLSKEEKDKLRKELLENAQEIENKQRQLRNAYNALKRAATLQRGDSAVASSQRKENDDESLVSEASARIQEEMKSSSTTLGEGTVEDVTASASEQVDGSQTNGVNRTRQKTVIDNRTTQLRVSLPTMHDGEVDAKEDVISALQDYGDVQVVHEDSSSVIVDLRNRRAAEKTLRGGVTVAGQQLTIDWYDPKRAQRDSEQKASEQVEAVVEEA